MRTCLIDGSGDVHQEAGMAGDRQTGPGVARTVTLYDVARAAGAPALSAAAR
jgi:hypothetical protein